MADFQTGDKVITRTGYTKGVVLEVIPGDKGQVHLDIQSDAGPKYRNCDARSWVRQSDYTGVERYPTPLGRGDRCYLTTTFDGEPMTFAGYVVTSNDKQLFMAFDEGMKSQWVPRTSVTRGEPPND